MITLSSIAKDSADWANRVAAQLVDQVNAAFKTPLRDAAAIVGPIHLNSTEKPVYHGLGAVPRGFIVVGASAGVVVFEGTRSPDPAKYLNLKTTTSGGLDAKLLFF